ncbi:MAG: hypothetical protein IIZ17_06240 [Eubacteriaceae bacterium]|nr:hypothetical protein [Eubacteriaceae bacterium]
MDIREIDDRYPEYARPYEPVKGAKRYKKLGLSSPVALLAITGLLVIFFAFSVMNAPLPPEIIPPVVTPPDVIITPVPPIDTDPDPTDPVIDPPIEDVTPPEDPIEDPVTDDPKGPQVSLSALNYWMELYHAEVIYVITANDAENITSSAVVTSARNPVYSFEVPETSGSGTIRYNADVIEHMEYESADYWNCVITVNYTLEGEAKSETFNLGASPTLADMPWLQDHGTVSSGPANAKTVTSNLVLSYPSDYRHTFEDAGFWEIKLGWMDADLHVVDEDSMKTVWNGWIGEGPFSGPTGPVSAGDRMELTYVYSGTVDATPPGPYSTAQYFYLEFSYGGDAHDTYDGAGYDVRNPESVCTYPQSLASSSAFTEPTVQLGDISYWGEFNGPYGLHHIEVDYNITLNDADPGSMSSDVTLQAYYTDTSDPYPVSGHTVSATGISGSGDLAAHMNSAGIMFFNSGESWQTVITMHYTVGGEAKTTTVTFDPKKPDKHHRLEMHTNGSIEIMDIYIGYDLDDPHVYDLRITEIALQFAANEYGYWETLGDPVPIWTEADGGMFSDPELLEIDTDSDGNPDAMAIHFITGPDSLAYNAISGMSVPSGATHFRLIFKAEGTGTDSRNSTVYTVVGGLTNWVESDDDYIELP